MALPVQRNLFGDVSPVGDIEGRILAAYRDNPKVSDSDRLLAFEVWKSEGLTEVLGDKLERFKNWFLERASSYETITRAGRKLRSESRMTQSPDVAEARRKLEETHRQFWAERGK